MTARPDRAAVITWDWLDHPDLDHLAQIIHDLSDGRIHLRQVTTGGDEYALIVSTAGLDDAAATNLYRRWLDDGQDMRTITTPEDPRE